MADLSLDLDPTSPSYGDLRLLGGDAVLTSDANPAGTQFILQSVMQRLRLYQGEWFLNTSLGVPYYQDILVKAPNRAYIDRLLQETIVKTPGVIALTAYEARLDGRTLSVRFTAQTAQGRIDYDGPLNSPASQVTQ